MTYYLLPESTSMLDEVRAYRETQQCGLREAYLAIKRRRRIDQLNTLYQEIQRGDMVTLQHAVLDLLDLLREDAVAWDHYEVIHR